ncbi:MAG: hypothetical protein ACLPY5_12115 [Candidatus Bathyarchaeia archaeon]
MNQEERVPVGLNLPVSILTLIDEKRGRINRSTYVAILLDKILKSSLERKATKQE